LLVYLDESGDLGFDFLKSKTSQYFAIALLVVYDMENNRKIEKGVERTLKNKIRKKKRKTNTIELKGSKTNFNVKEYFYRQIKDCNFGIYSIVLNKKRVYPELRKNKERLYNYLARLILEKCPFRKVRTRLILTVDKSKAKKEQGAFDRYLIFQIQGILPPKVPLEIYHIDSKKSKGVQAIDMFIWGIFRKYEKTDLEWYKVFKEKIKLETVFLK